MAAYEERRRELDERAVAIAWHTVAIENEMRNAGRLVSLSATIEKYVPRPVHEQKKPKSSANVAAQLELLSQRYGIPLKPMSEETWKAMRKPPVTANG